MPHRPSLTCRSPPLTETRRRLGTRARSRRFEDFLQECIAVNGASEDGRTDNLGHSPSAATQADPYGTFPFKRGVAGRAAKPAFNELGAISFTIRGRGERTAT